jgi:LuxR family maltose regulon positive regulatory protein
VQETLNVRDRARFRPPDASSTIVERRRLDGIYAGARGRVVRVVAPGGYGKSSLVARWVTGEERVVRWVDLERVDNDPVALLSTLARAFAGFDDLPLGSLPAPRDGGPEFADQILPRLARLLRTCGAPFVLVLDDVQRIEDETARALVDTLAEHLPSCSTLVLCGRALRDDGATGRLRLRPGMLDVTVPDLRLTTPEAGRLLSSMGVELADDELAPLVERFEGWPAGLRLAGLVLLDGRPTLPTSPADVDDADFIVDYLRAEWTGRLPPEDLALLREAAVLERFTGELCDEVLGRRGSTGRLRRLHHDELVVLPLDRREEWYRMHPLLVRWLTEDLRRGDPARWRAVHLSAADHWSAVGDIDLAVRHAERGGDLDRCERLVAAHAPRYYSSGMHGTVERWLAVFPAERVRSSAPLCGIAALMALYAGDGARAERWRRTVERIDPDRSGDAATVRWWADVLVAVLDERAAGELLPIAWRAREHAAPGAWRGLACWAVGALLFLDGDDRAGELLAEGELEAELGDAPLLRANCLAAGAIVAEVGGDRERAERNGRRARALVADRRAEMVPTVAPVLAMSALIEARAGRRDAAQREIDTARRDLAGLRTVAPWFNALARLALVRAALHVDDRVAARTLARELEHHVRLEPRGRGVVSDVVELRTKVDATPSIAGGTTELTEAELRVLRHLPTNLNLADIAVRLYVSRNTVKSHAAAIYRKLGTTSRRAAVEVARDAGLLAEDRADVVV